MSNTEPSVLADFPEYGSAEDTDYQDPTFHPFHLVVSQNEQDHNTPQQSPLAKDFLPRDLTGRIHREMDTIHPSHAGGFADIFIGYLREEDNTSIKVAIKVLRLQSEEVADKVSKTVSRETEIWQKLRHTNVLRFLGLTSDFGRFSYPALISPYCDNGTAPDYLKLHPEIETRLFLVSQPD
ncbi:hypothetical protein AN958_08942 [Leucoagaricus sp. SymC.cos]|nr:hypothetical protein AN958_08942 [Leucoagaricus sp. SymC.cos]